MLEPHAGERILEIGFGTGQSLVPLAEAVGEKGKVYGVDLSSRMLDVANARARRAGLDRRVEPRSGDAIQFPFGADSFDAIFASFVLELFATPEIPCVAAECHRVVKGGGRICVLSLQGRQTEPGARPVRMASSEVPWRRRLSTHLPRESFGGSRVPRRQDNFRISIRTTDRDRARRKNRAGLFSAPPPAIRLRRPFARERVPLGACTPPFENLARGFIPGWGIFNRRVEVAGKAHAAELLLPGDRVSGP